MTGDDREVPVERLCNCLNPDDLGFETTAEMSPLEGVLGQDRALAALDLGLQLFSHGYHVHASGPTGTGKMSAIGIMLEHVKTQRPTPPDWCYVHDFAETDEPIALSLPPGRGRELAQDMDRFIDDAIQAIQRSLERDDYALRKGEVLRVFADQRGDVSRKVQEDARQEGFAVELSPTGVEVIRLVDGRPSSPEELERLLKGDSETRR